MATESNKRTALAEFKDRHKHVHFMLVEEDTLHLRVNGLVAGTRNIPLHYLAKGVFHPIAAYTRSITRVFRRSKAFADKLFSFEEEHRNKPLESAGNLLGVQYDALLDSYESYLFALEGRVPMSGVRAGARLGPRRQAGPVMLQARPAG